MKEEASKYPLLKETRDIFADQAVASLMDMNALLRDRRIPPTYEGRKHLPIH